MAQTAQQNVIANLLNNERNNVVVGLHGINGVVQRLDIDDLMINEPDTFNLLLLALKGIKSPDDGAYDKLAGFHGYPNLYCAHGTPNFGPWHRPYLAMYEAALYRKMLQIVQSAKDQQRWNAAAAKFRFPYWDYWRPRANQITFPGIASLNTQQTTSPYDFRLPEILTVAQVMIEDVVTGNRTLQDNPFTYFDLSSPIQKQIASNSGLKGYSALRTFRHPQAVSGATISNNTNLNDFMRGLQQDSTRSALMMLERPQYKNYMAFATAAVPTGQAPKYGSIEALHGQYHVMIGWTDGHMGVVEISAFDPIFWLHHTNIDRILAIWQAINPWGSGKDPNLWVNGIDKFKSGQPAYADEDLVPFKKSNGSFWRANDTYSTEALGYTYPEIAGFATPQAVFDNFKLRYDWARPLTAQEKSSGVKPKEPPKWMEPPQVYLAPAFAYGTSSAEVAAKKAFDEDMKNLNRTQATSTVAAVAQTVAQAVQKPQQIFSIAQTAQPEAQPQVSREWYVDDVVKRLALNGTFAILYFVGDISINDPNGFPTKPTLAGMHAVFTKNIEGCSNCREQDENNVLESDTSSITSILIDYVQNGELQSLNPEHVKPFLVKNLKWRVVGPEGNLVDPRTVAGLKLNVSCDVAALPGTAAEGEVTVENYPEVIDEIIAAASGNPTFGQ